jgi:2-polyprenyl-6-methoxyphenol hydroxylase-like FAD-dependent oxidoreductase
MHELGVLDEFLRLPHQEVARLVAQFGDFPVPIADFTHLPTHCKFIAMMPQWDFLDFLARQAARYPTFQLAMQAEATGLIEEAGRVTGVRGSTPAGPLEVRADLLVAADGRSSVLREKAGLHVQDLGAPMDVLWFRLSRRPEDPEATMGRFDVGRIFVLINRGLHWQCGYVIPKGSADEVRRRGLDAFRGSVAALLPFARDRVAELRDWDDVKLLTVKVDRLRQWYRPGLLCIGDAAHAMSPVGGVGINLAIQDAVAAANRLWRPLRERRLTADDLRRVQRRREWPTRVTQGLQLMVQRRVITPALGGAAGRLAPLRFARFLARCPFARRLPARLVGVGVRPEHVETPAAR